jgi:hypothetical protein
MWIGLSGGKGKFPDREFYPLPPLLFLQGQYKDKDLKLDLKASLRTKMTRTMINITG